MDLLPRPRCLFRTAVPFPGSLNHQVAQVLGVCSPSWYGRAGQSGACCAQLECAFLADGCSSRDRTGSEARQHFGGCVDPGRGCWRQPPGQFRQRQARADGGPHLRIVESCAVGVVHCVCCRSGQTKPGGELLQVGYARIVARQSEASEFDDDPIAAEQVNQPSQRRSSPVGIIECPPQMPFAAAGEDLPVGLKSGEFFEFEHRPVLFAAHIGSGDRR